jgi:hypothetical protein
MPDTAPHTHPASRSLVVSTSLLRLSGGQRIAIAAGMAMLLWGAVVWAIG